MPNGKTLVKTRRNIAPYLLDAVLLMFESVLARDESHHAAFGMNVFTAALEAAIRAVRIDRPLLVTLYR